MCEPVHGRAYGLLVCVCSENWPDLKQDLGYGKKIRTQTNRQNQKNKKQKQSKTEPNEARGLEERMAVAKVMGKQTFRAES